MRKEVGKREVYGRFEQRNAHSSNRKYGQFKPKVLILLQYYVKVSYWQSNSSNGCFEGSLCMCL